MADAPTVPTIFRAYLQVLRGGRTYAVLAEAMGLKDKAVGHILRGRNAVQDQHLQHICEAWGIKPHEMLADMAQVALNLKLGRPAAEGLGGRVYGPKATGADETRRTEPPASS